MSDYNGKEAARESDIQNADSILTDELKKEASESVNQVKDIIKNVDIKEEARKTQGFFKEMMANPIGKIKAIAGNSSRTF